MKYFTTIVLCFLILLIIFINFNINIKEDIFQLPSGSNSAQINTIEDMRAFLEQMYLISILNPNDQLQYKTYNTICYKNNILASYLWTVLGPYTYLSLDEISQLFGASTKPTSIVEDSASQQNNKPPPIPIIVNDTDYKFLLQLAIIGNIIQPFTVAPFNQWNSSVIWTKDDAGNTRDACKERWGGYQGSVALNTLYLEEIKTILAYFHAQTDSQNKLYNGDNLYTQLY